MSATPQNNDQKAASANAEPAWLTLVHEYVSGLRFGVVQITVQAGQVAPIERTEKLRLDKPERVNPTGHPAGDNA